MLLKPQLLGLLFISILHTACNSAKEIVVKLTPADGLNREMDNRASTAQPIPADSAQKLYAQRIGLKDYIVTRFQHRPWEKYYHEWKEGKRDSASYASLLNRYGDNDYIPESLPKLDAESNFLFGRKATGEYLLVADENNNNSFSDDSIRTIKNPIRTNKLTDTETYPIIQIRNLEAFYNGSIKHFNARIEVRPTIIVDSTKTPDTRFYVHSVTSENFTGRFRFKGKTYKVAAGNTKHPVRSNKQEHIKVKFAEGKEDSAFQKYWYTRPEYYKDDTALIGKRAFVIKQVSPFFETITLKPLKKAPQKGEHKGLDSLRQAIGAGGEQKWIGKPYPSFSIQNNQKLLTNETLLGKVIFINFWFEACPPCIAEFEALSHMYERLKDSVDVAFISLTFENPEVIKRVREKYGLSFPIYTISMEECKQLNLNNGYPTNIIVDKKGIITALHVGGATSKEEAKKFIDQEIYTKIITESK
jgi:thiol-disulfide isomerase/thioredoxin